jgi:cell division septum initiation protein DivIVA
MDVYDRLNQLTATVRGAKTMPMSASCLVNRAEMLEVLERLRDELPTTLNHADALLSDRQAVLAAGREQAERIVEAARGERERLIQQTEVLVVARERAATLTMEARAESTRLLADADDYVDRKLAEFEVLLGQLTLQLNNGRLRLTTRREADLARFQEETQGKARESAGANADEDEGLLGQAAQSAGPSAPELVGHERPATADVSLGA